MDGKPVVSRFIIVKRPYNFFGRNDVGLDERNIFFLQGVFQKPVYRSLGGRRMTGANNRPSEQCAKNSVYLQLLNPASLDFVPTLPFETRLQSALSPYLNEPPLRSG